MLPCRHHTSARTAALCYAARRWPHDLKAPSMHIPPLSTIATTADRDQAEAALIRDGAVAFPAVFPDDRMSELRDGLEAAVRTTAETLAGKGMPVPEVGIEHHVLPSHPSFAGQRSEDQTSELQSLVIIWYADYRLKTKQKPIISAT